jgi:tRNA pseudouridine55 synthase
LASGLLIIFFNKATKLCSLFLGADKSYEAIIKLGYISETGDSDGEIISVKDVPNLNDHDLRVLEEKYTGVIEQVPPMYSALKHKGVRLYEYARKGINIERDARKVTIYNVKLDILDRGHLALKVKCSKGTYIRTLAEQIGEDIGCGALLSKLVRTKINNIDLSSAVNFEDFLSSSDKDICEKHMRNVDSILDNIDAYQLSETDKIKILNGNKVLIDAKPCKMLKFYDLTDNFLGVGEVNDNSELIPKKILV